MCACSEAFLSLRACAVLVVGVAGTMPVHGIGTACFLVKQNGKECVVKIHNCLLCHGEDQFNLISVSQVLRARTNSITFSADESRLEIDNDNDEKVKTIFALREHEGLYELEVSPLCVDDERIVEILIMPVRSCAPCTTVRVPKHERHICGRETRKTEVFVILRFTVCLNIEYRY